MGVELCLSLVGAWGGAEVSLEMNFRPCEDWGVCEEWKIIEMVWRLNESWNEFTGLGAEFYSQCNDFLFDQILHAQPNTQYTNPFSETNTALIKNWKNIQKDSKQALSLCFWKVMEHDAG